jgi:hypothetical protein
VLPRRLVLVIDDNDEPGRALSALAARGLEIVRGEKRLGPHNKWYPVLREGNLESDYLVTGDDDILYPRTWLRDLLCAARPNRIVAYRAHPIILDGEQLAPYRRWMDAQPKDTDSLLITGVSGVAYPREFCAILAAKGDAFMECTPRNDDIWISKVALETGWPVGMVTPGRIEFPVVPGSQRVALMKDNVGLSRNDDSAAATFTAEDIAAIRRNTEGI